MLRYKLRTLLILIAAVELLLAAICTAYGFRAESSELPLDDGALAEI